ncbi:MAG: cysteine hydrolase [Elainellaceae cyanobacterium]
MSQPAHLLGIPPNAWIVNDKSADITRSPLLPQPITLVTATKAVTLDLAKTIILVIDMQNDFCHPEGWLAHIGVDVTPAQAPIAPLNRLLPLLRRAKVPVLWLNWGNRPDLLNIGAGLRYVYNPTGTGIGLVEPLPPRNAPVLTKESWGAAIVDELVPNPEDIRVDKYRMSGFWDTPLDSILRNLGKTTLLFAGVNADQCVMATLQDANFHGYDCILVEDCTATTSPDYCFKATVYNVNQCFGFVTTSGAIAAVIPEVSSELV